MNVITPVESVVEGRLPAYKNVKHLSTGGFKAVYKAEISGKVEALKFVQIPPINEELDTQSYRKEVVGRVRREIEALAKCKRQELVKLGKLQPMSIEIDGHEYVAYSEEFLEGIDLWDALKKSDQYPSERELKRLFVSLLCAIRELWGNGYVHRDIKPKNIIKLENAKRPFVLLDLGIAFSITETALTYDPHRIVATYRYLAPEMASPTFRENMDYRSDLYTSALSVFEYAAKQHPLAHDSDDMIRTVSRALHQAPTPLESLRKDLSTEFCQLVNQMLKKKPALRPSNLDELISRLEG